MLCHGSPTAGCRAKENCKPRFLVSESFAEHLASLGSKLSAFTSLYVSFVFLV